MRSSLLGRPLWKVSKNRPSFFWQASPGGKAIIAEAWELETDRWIDGIPAMSSTSLPHFAFVRDRRPLGPEIDEPMDLSYQVPRTLSPYVGPVPQTLADLMHELLDEELPWIVSCLAQGRRPGGQPI